MHAHSSVTSRHTASKPRRSVNPNPTLPIHPMASSSSHRRRRAGSDGDEGLEEGEFVPGSGGYSSASDDSEYDDDDRYSRQSCRPGKAAEEEEIRPPPQQLIRRLEEIVARGRVTTRSPSPTPSYESDDTISDDDRDGGHDGALYAGVDARPRRVYSSCHDYTAVTAGWAATGKRGCTGGSKGKAVAGSSSSSDLNHSVSRATPVSPPQPNLPFLQPVPLAFARSNLSSLSMLSRKTNLESGETSSPQSVHNGPVVAAPEEANPSKEEQQARQVVLQLAPALPPVRVPPRASTQEYSCKICGKTYTSHQGLGGHAAGHRNRQKEAEARAAAAGNGGVIPAPLGCKKEHPCNKCGKVFPTGVALGGHKRMHYEGPPIVHRRKKRCEAPPPPPVLVAPAAVGDELTLALGIKAGQPSSPAATGCRVRLFGIDIGGSPTAQAPAPVVQEGSDDMIKPQEEAPPVVQEESGDMIKPQEEAPPVVQEGTDSTPHDEEAAQEGSSAMTTVGSASAGGQAQDETVEQSGTDSPSKESSN